ncbi:DUF2333 family protein [Pseudomarimonas salicorniae]|uniref:DUF2333 family protein n=1 Tax=Pseudomarimonas salicorniae TaxID=2933270 RepID=A0ABT0GMM2_9GAMM|nr:DUF2333 family protein [Lysobacter sp. CAU 1642]MCK7595469.1 DUF2333 family protein [Lysobacter sp. CAU 1642]
MSLKTRMTPKEKRHLWIRIVTAVVAIWLLVACVLWWWWDYEPRPFDVVKSAQKRASAEGQPVVVGSVTTSTLIRVSETLLDKRGGYLSNDYAPPGVWMDNVPNWEFGALVQVRDLAKAFRNEFSRSQTQSTEDPDLLEADPLFSTPSDRWLLPASENQYRKAIGHVDAYLTRLTDDDEFNAQFYARADNLADWLAVVEKRLGSLSQRLSASVGQIRVDTDLGGDKDARQSTPAPDVQTVRTPWLKVDDVFYEARGSTWALLHFLRAVEHDFEPVLRDKNALVSLRQIIRELEESQTPLFSPIVLNGSPYGFFANHSLVMANYISRANAAVIDLRKLLERG